MVDKSMLDFTETYKKYKLFNYYILTLIFLILYNCITITIHYRIFID